MNTHNTPDYFRDIEHARRVLDSAMSYICKHAELADIEERTKQKVNCPLCSASITPYWLGLRKRHLRVLWKAYRYAIKHRTHQFTRVELQLQNSEYVNMVALLSYGLLEDTGDIKDGLAIYRITNLAGNFVLGQARIPDRLLRYRAKTVKKSDKMIRIQDILSAEEMPAMTEVLSSYRNIFSI